MVSLGKILNQADLEDKMARAQADGLLSPEDAEEVITFGGFLDEAGPAPGHEGYNRDRFAAAYKKYYPEEYRRMMEKVRPEDRR